MKGARLFLALLTCCILGLSLSLTPQVMAGDGDDPTPCEGDVDGDGFVSVLDLIEVLLAWGPCPDKEPCPADLNGDGTVNVQDLLTVVLNFGPCDDAATCETDEDCDDGDPNTIDICINGFCVNFDLPGGDG